LGRFEELPPDAFERVIRTNVIGYANGARAALRQFRAQGDRGTLINVGSVLGLVGEPYVSAYGASKFAIRGLTACLRQEVRDRPGIAVCGVLPPALDTPIYQHAANFFGRKARSIFPVYDPARVAEIVVRRSVRPKAQTIVGGFGWLVSGSSRLAPRLIERMIARFAPRLQFETDTARPHEGNLFHSAGEHAVHGGWRPYWRGKLVGGSGRMEQGEIPRPRRSEE
jgi:NAD(P)-dependent dehydrogenase (short-subunit alcohol dehydrogenase family)